MITSFIKSLDNKVVMPLTDRAKYLAYADLFDPVLGHIGSQTEETQAGNEDAETGEQSGQCALDFRIVEFPGIFLIDKPGIERIVGVVF